MTYEIYGMFHILREMAASESRAKIQKRNDQYRKRHMLRAYGAKQTQIIKKLRNEHTKHK